MSRVRLARAIAGLVAVAIVFAGCGDDDSSSSATPEVPGAATDDADVSPSVFGGTECGGVVSDFLDAMSAFGQAFSGTDDNGSFDDAVELLDSYADAAPEEIRDSFQVLADEMGAFYDAFAEIDFTPGEIPDEETQAQLAQLGELVDDEALEAASDDIEQWFEANCAE